VISALCEVLAVSYHMDKMNLEEKEDIGEGIGEDKKVGSLEVV
jgi:hypothetical protein